MTKRTSPRQQLVALIDAEKSIIGSEEGHALNVEGFIGQALDHLRAGNYEGFLTCADLAGQFAKQARDEMYCRRQRIERVDRARASGPFADPKVRAKWQFVKGDASAERARMVKMTQPPFAD